MRIKKWIEAVMNAIFFVCGMVAILSVVLITVYMFVSGIPAIVEIGPINFLFGTVWKKHAKEPHFGAFRSFSPVCGHAGRGDHR